MAAPPPGVADHLIQLLPLTLDSTPMHPAPISLAAGAPSSYSQADLDKVNELARILLTASNPSVVFPPPPQPVPNDRSRKCAQAKEAGNAAFKAGNWQDAIKLYTISAEVAAGRPVFEANVYARDELALALANRSAAYMGAGEFVNALVDADAVIQLKRPWIKGHFRRGKALIGMGRLEEGREALLLGLQFDPTAEVRTLLSFLCAVLTSLTSSRTFNKQFPRLRNRFATFRSFMSLPLYSVPPSAPLYPLQGHYAVFVVLHSHFSVRAKSKRLLFVSQLTMSRLFKKAASLESDGGATKIHCSTSMNERKETQHPP